MPSIKKTSCHPHAASDLSAALRASSNLEKKEITGRVGYVPFTYRSY
jgi:hypothetical protein